MLCRADSRFLSGAYSRFLGRFGATGGIVRSLTNIGTSEGSLSVEAPRASSETRGGEAGELRLLLLSTLFIVDRSGSSDDRERRSLLLPLGSALADGRFFTPPSLSLSEAEESAFDDAASFEPTKGAALNRTNLFFQS